MSPKIKRQQQIPGILFTSTMLLKVHWSSIKTRENRGNNVSRQIIRDLSYLMYLAPSANSVLHIINVIYTIAHFKIKPISSGDSSQNLTWFFKAALSYCVLCWPPGSRTSCKHNSYMSSCSTGQFRKSCLHICVRSNTLCLVSTTSWRCLAAKRSTMFSLTESVCCLTLRRYFNSTLQTHSEERLCYRWWIWSFHKDSAQGQC